MEVEVAVTKVNLSMEDMTFALTGIDSDASCSFPFLEDLEHGNVLLCDGARFRKSFHRGHGFLLAQHLLFLL